MKKTKNTKNKGVYNCKKGKKHILGVFEKNFKQKTQKTSSLLKKKTKNSKSEFLRKKIRTKNTKKGVSKFFF